MTGGEIAEEEMEEEVEEDAQFHTVEMRKELRESSLSLPSTATHCVLLTTYYARAVYHY